MSTEETVEQRRAWWDLLAILLPLLIAAIVGLIVLVDSVEDDDADDGAGPVSVETEDGGEESAADGEAEGEGSTTIVDLAVATPELSTLVELVTDAGLAETLAGEGPFTVFAPTNEAFDAAIAALGDALTPEVVEEVLLYHVAEGTALAADVIAAGEVSTVQGEIVTVTVDGDTVALNDGQATVAAADVVADNGVVHVIDGVLLPPTIVAALAAADADEADADEADDAEPAVAATVVDYLAADDRFGALVGAVTDAGLAEALSAPGSFTVFAPTDEAFEAAVAALGESAEDPELIEAVLLYHVINSALSADIVVAAGSWVTLLGEPVSVDVVDGQVVVGGTATVIEADIVTGNGIIHVVDAVLVPPSILDALSAGDDGELAGESIAEVLAGDERFTSLLGVVETLGLTETLAGDGPFTVFAPTDEAFEAALEALGDSADDTDLLEQIVTFHVVAGEVDAETVVGSESLTSLQGEDISVEVDGDAVVVAGTAQVIEADVRTGNGIIHVVDAVLLPPTILEQLG